MDTSRFNRPEFFTNRELSWLEFNQRVLEEAQDPSNPLLERLKFLCITCSNLDEFFEIRVAGIKQQIESGVTETDADGMTPLQIFEAIRTRALRMVHDQYRLWHDDLHPQLTKHGIEILAVDELSDPERMWARDYFLNEVFPVLTPLAIDPSHPFPQLLNKSLNMIIWFQKPGAEEKRAAIVQVPRSLNRIIPFPAREGVRHRFVLLNNLIRAFVSHLFPGNTLHGAYSFRITRNSDLYIDDEEAQNLLRTIEMELQNRNRGNAVRLELQADAPQEVRTYLLDKFQLGEADLYPIDGPMNLLRLMPLCSVDAPPHLKDKPFHPVTPAPLLANSDIFDVLRQQDILLHHPYESFQSVVDFVEKAAVDPRVLAIKMTLYRTSGDSPIVKALIAAAQNEKQVTVLVELKARFDEANNIAWARRMEEAGIHVLYGLVGLKTHCKLLMVVRRDEDQIRHYVHLGTGNYHPRTARLYTDISLLTTRKRLTSEVAALFNTLTGMSEYGAFSKLLVAPFDLARRFLDLIATEEANARLGLPSGIFAKMNSLVDEQIIKALYSASCAGVPIHLMVRGICCLRPGIPGVSENITVTSVVDRLLEHSRIFCFENGGNKRIYLGSADWMPRNLYRRVEVIFPVEDKKLKARLTDEIIATYIRDNVKARRLGPDGIHLPPVGGEPAVRCQAEFMARALTPPPQTAKKTASTPPKSTLQLQSRPPEPE
jgi:polyphosphate kinase